MNVRQRLWQTMGDSLAPIFVLIALGAVHALAGTTGKIAGRIVDKSGGAALPGVTVLLEGTKIGSATDPDGNYSILNVPPGTYRLRATTVGYSAQVVTNVVVNVDLTTTINLSLTEEGVEMREIVVTAERPLIKRDETSRTAIVEAETFLELPIRSFQEVVSLQTGFVIDDDGALHARGGRSNEVVYLIDGIAVRDPLSGGFGSRLDKYAIQELQVLTGGFSAEYGQALSGVVNIVTREGGEQYRGRIEYTSNPLGTSVYHSADALALDFYGRDSTGRLVQRTDRGGRTLTRNIPSAYQSERIEDTPPLAPDINALGEFSAMLSGPVPMLNDFRFFVTSRLENTLSQLPWGFNKEREVNGKLTYASGSVKLSLLIQRSYRLYKPYSHIWKYRPEGYESRKDFSWRDNLIASHVLGEGTFYEVSLSHTRRHFNRFTPGRFAFFTPDGNLIASNYVPRDNNIPQFWTTQDNGEFIRNDTRTFSLKADLTSQVDRYNLLKTGVIINRYDIDRERFQEPYVGGFHAYELFKKEPWDLAAYLQNKLELGTFIINAGLRLDYVDVNDDGWANLLSPPRDIDTSARYAPDPTDLVKTEPKFQLSPRLGIAFPISDKTVFYSSYGHFFQVPDYLEVYALRDPTVDRALVGNPAIKPQKTIAFEFGVKQQLGEDYALDLGVYFKDITNLVGSTYHTVFPYEYTLFDNSDYGKVNGVEVTLTKRYSSYVRGSLNYTYSVAKGNESDPREGFNEYRRANAIFRPKRVFFLDFHRPHVFNANIGILLPKGFGPSVAGWHLLEDLNINLVYRVSSGLPYTPTSQDEIGELQVEKNSGIKPSTQQLDLRIQKGFDLLGGKLLLFAIATNVFDDRNVENVWTVTGDPWDAGPLSSRPLDRQRNPGNIGSRRSVQIGSRFEF